MSTLTDALECIRSHPEVSKYIHVHRGDVIYDPEANEGWHKVTICAAHSWKNMLFGDYDQFVEGLWPQSIMWPNSITTARGYGYRVGEDHEEIDTSPQWLRYEGTPIISGSPNGNILAAFKLRRMIELHIYRMPCQLRHCQEPLTTPHIYLRR